MKEKNLIPALRFKGFTETWEQRKLGSIFEEFSKKSKEENEYPVLSSTNIGMEHREGRVSGKSNVGYKIIETGDLVLSPQNLWLGNININNLGTGLVSPSYKTYKIRKLISDFIRPQLKTDRMIAEYKYASTQGASVVRRNLDLDRFNNIQIRIPSTVEQQSIGSFFSTLDHLITLQQRELESLKAAKKTLLSKMLPKKGETIPEVHFPGFTDAWELRKLKDITTESFGGGTPKTSVNEYWKGNIPWFQSKDILEDKLFDNQPQKFITKEAIEKSATKLIPSNSIAIVTRVGVGKLSLIPYQFCTSQDFHSLSGLLIDEKFAVYAIYKLLQSEKVNAQGTSIKGITISELLSKSLFIPCDKSEQKSIGSFFSALDHLITLQQCKPLMFISLTLKAIS